MYTVVENMETVPDEEVEKREQLMMHHINYLVKLFVILITMGRKPQSYFVFCKVTAMIYEFFCTKTWKSESCEYFYQYHR